MKQIIFLVLSIMAITCFSQVQEYDVYFGYDLAGNRSSRYIVYPPGHPESKGGGDVEEIPVKEESPQTVNELTKEQVANIKVYPVPTQDMVNVVFSDEYEESIMKHVICYDINGRIISKKSFKSNRYTVDLTSSNAGEYFLKVEVGKKASTWTILKK